MPPDINFSGLGFKIEDLAELSTEDLERQLTKVAAKKAGLMIEVPVRHDFAPIANVDKIDARRKKLLHCCLRFMMSMGLSTI